MRQRHSLVALGAVVVCVASVVVASQGGKELPQATTSASTVAPSSMQLSCPETPTDRVTLTRLFAVTPGDATGGSLTAETLSSSAPVGVGESDELGVPIDEPLSTSDGPSVVVSAKGRAAPGVTAFQLSTSQGRHRSGLAVSACPRVAAEWWFNGVDTNVGATSRLVLSNPTTGLAVVDVLVFGQQGRVAAPGSRGIGVAAQSRTSVDLARLAPGVENATVRVRATRGRLAAAVATTKVDGATPAGSEWVPPAIPPGTDLLVNGGVPGPGRRQQLILTNPGGREALVQVAALDENGPFRPTALTDVRVDPGSVVVTDITDIADRGSLALHVTANADVTAGIVTATLQSRPDFAVSTVGEPLTADPAIIPVLRRSRMLLCTATAGPAGGSVSVELVAATGQSERTEVIRVRGRATSCRPLDLEPLTSYVALTADESDAISAVVHVVGRSGVSTIPVSPGLWEIVQPPVEPAP